MDPENNIIPNDSAHEKSLFTSAPPTPLRNSSSLASKNSTISKQYVNSAGGGCVSPVGDASPHILISSENHFPYNQSEIFGVNTEKEENLSMKTFNSLIVTNNNFTS